jgi:hypothetical protein
MMHWNRVSKPCSDAVLDSHSQLDCIVRRIHQILLRTQVSLGRLDRSVPEQQLNLLKLATCRAA